MVEVETVGWELVLKQILQCAAGKSNLHVIFRFYHPNSTTHTTILLLSLISSSYFTYHRSRGRQYIDNKASCRENEYCRNDDPGDNTDSCWTTTEGDDGMKMNIK